MICSDLFTDDPQAAEGRAQGGELRAKFVKDEVAAGSVEDVVLCDVVPSFASSSCAIASSPIRIKSWAHGLSEMRPGTFLLDLSFMQSLDHASRPGRGRSRPADSGRPELGWRMAKLDVVAVIAAKPGSEAIVEEALKTLVVASRRDHGCLSYEAVRLRLDTWHICHHGGMAVAGRLRCAHGFVAHR